MHAQDDDASVGRIVESINLDSGASCRRSVTLAN